MPADRTDLAARLAQARPADTVRGMFFNNAVAVVKRRAPEAAARVVAGQPTFKWIDIFSYPVADYLKLAWDCADALEAAHAEPDADAAFRALGRGAVDIFFASPIGKTLLTLVGGNPRRLIANYAMAYRSATSYGERTVVWHGERSASLAFRRDFMPASYHEGVVAAALEYLGGHDVRVRGARVALLDTDYDATWS